MKLSIILGTRGEKHSNNTVNTEVLKTQLILI